MNRPTSESQDRLGPAEDSSLRRKKSDTRVRYPMIVPNDENSNGPSTNSEVNAVYALYFMHFYIV